MRDLATIYAAGITTPDGYGDKGTAHSYIDVYEKLLAPLRETARAVLEIGVGPNALSLKMWREYFPNAQIVGIDPDPVQVSLPNRVTVIWANAYDSETVRKLDTKFDVIIDDGSHSFSDQQAAVRLYRPLLAPGGILIIEDVANFTRETENAFRKIGNCEVFDRRHVKNRYDDVLVVYRQETESLNVMPIELPYSSLWHIGETMRDVDPMLAWIAARFRVESFLDVGAHVGEISLLALFHFGPKLTVHAYEPHPTLAEMCRKNFRTVGLEPSRVVEAALCIDRSKTEIELHERGKSFLGCSTSMTDRVVRTLKVPAVHPEALPSVHVIGIDVEGVEAEIVEGYPYWSMPHCAIIETHSREQSARIHSAMTQKKFELVRHIEHPHFPFRLELWSR